MSTTTIQADTNAHLAELATAPVGPSERISSVDMIRGFALLGILLMNIVGFAWPHQAYNDPTIAAGDSGKNLAAWFFNYVLFDGKMRALFSMLFGASVVLMTSRAEQRVGQAQIADIYYRRMLWLLLFGIIDAYVTGMMLLGMGLLKLGVFSAIRSNRFYALMVLVGYGIGIPLNAWIASRNVASHFDLANVFQNACAYDAGRFSVALGHVGLMMLIYRAGLLRFLTSALAAVGQMALSNYLFQNIVCTLLFNGYGFGLFGRIERFQLYGVVLAVWVVQLVASPIWLRYFRFGPMEWLWRSLTYWRRQPMRIRGAVGYQPVVG